MHLEHVPADKLFIDFAGDKVGIYSSPGAKEPKCVRVNTKFSCGDTNRDRRISIMPPCAQECLARCDQ